MTIKTPTTHRGPRPARSGFTLIELLTVIAILALLVSILMPSLNRAKEMARETKTRGLFRAIETGLELFHGDERFGDAYPPSTWDATNDGDPYEGTLHDDDTAAQDYTATGAETLRWALTGADDLGTAGFEPDTGQSLSNEETDTNGDTGLYDLDNNGKPNFPRRGPYLDTDKYTTGSYLFKNTGRTKSKTESDIAARVILDAFGYPVLYFKADLRPDDDDPENIYTFADNADALRLTDTDQKGSTSWGNDSAFRAYIKDQAVDEATGGNAYSPENPRKFILISAGSDGIYGEDEDGDSDDITNFKGQQ